VSREGGRRTKKDTKEGQERLQDKEGKGRKEKEGVDRR
jgi:hypothetical protein